MQCQSNFERERGRHRRGGGTERRDDREEGEVFVYLCDAARIARISSSQYTNRVPSDSIY